MYIVHGIAHPYDDLSTSWVIDVYNNKEEADKLLDEFNSILSKKEERYVLTDEEKSALKSIHHRALPNGYIKDKYWNSSEGILDDKILGDEYIIQYFVSNVSSTNCYASNQRWC
jgi:hypothetical protein